jgi:hypothetical protein
MHKDIKTYEKKSIHEDFDTKEN